MQYPPGWRQSVPARQSPGACPWVSSGGCEAQPKVTLKFWANMARLPGIFFAEVCFGSFGKPSFVEIPPEIGEMFNRVKACFNWHS